MGISLRGDVKYIWNLELEDIDTKNHSYVLALSGNRTAIWSARGD
jgi:hypothetical protein